MDSIPHFTLIIITPWRQKVTMNHKSLSPLLKLGFDLKQSHWYILRGNRFLLSKPMNPLYIATNN